MKAKQKQDSFTYENLFEAYCAGDTESVRVGDRFDKNDFEEWFKNG